MARLFANNAKGTLASSINDSATTITLQTGEGANFPSPSGGDYFDLTLTESGIETAWEIVKVTARSSDTLTVTRGQYGTTATSWVADSKAELRIHAAMAGDFVVADESHAFTKPQRGVAVSDNDLSFDLDAGNNFSCAPTTSGTLTFTNIASAAGQSGTIVLNNSGGYAIAAAATTKKDSSFLTTISAAGTYRISYYCDGTNVYCTTSQAQS